MDVEFVVVAVGVPFGLGQPERPLAITVAGFGNTRPQLRDGQQIMRLDAKIDALPHALLGKSRAIYRHRNLRYGTPNSCFQIASCCLRSARPMILPGLAAGLPTLIRAETRTTLSLSQSGRQPDFTNSVPAISSTFCGAFTESGFLTRSRPRLRPILS